MSRTRLLWLGLLVLLLAAGSYLGGRYAWGCRLLRLAQDETESLDFDAAADHLAHCERILRDDPQVLLAQARVLRRLGRLDEAAAVLEKLRPFASQQQEVSWEDLCLAAQQGAMRPDEEQRLLDAVGRFPERGNDALEAVCLGRLRNYRLAEGVHLAEQWRAKQPGHAPAHHLHGLLLEGFGHLGAAAKDYERAVALRPAYAAPRLRLAECQLAQLDAASACEHFELLVKQHREPFAGLLGLARCRLQLGQLEAAGHILGSLAESHPDQVAVWLAKGSLAAADQRHADAVAHLRRAASLDPHDLHVMHLLATSLRHLGQLDESVQLLRKHQATRSDLERLRALGREIGLHPELVKERREAAQLCLRNGQPREAVRWLTGLLQLAPDDREALALLAECQQRPAPE